MYIYILVNKYVTPNYGDSVFELTYNTYFHINHNQNNVEDLYSVLSFYLSLSHMLGLMFLPLLISVEEFRMSEFNLK